MFAFCFSHNERSLALARAGAGLAGGLAGRRLAGASLGRGALGAHRAAVAGGGLRLGGRARGRHLLEATGLLLASTEHEGSSAELHL